MHDFTKLDYLRYF